MTNMTHLILFCSCRSTIETHDELPRQKSSISIGFKSVYNPKLYEDVGDNSEEEDNSTDWHEPTHEIVNKLNRTTSLRGQMSLLHLLLQREGTNFKISERTVLDGIIDIYRKASYLKHWSVVRYGAALLGKLVDSLAPSITTMLVSGRQV